MTQEREAIAPMEIEAGRKLADWLREREDTNYAALVDRLTSAAELALRSGGEPSSNPSVSPATAADVVARSLCAERCALYGDPPCYTLDGVDWDGGKRENLHDTDCATLAKVALKAAAAGQPLTGLAQDGSSQKNDEAHPDISREPEQ